MSLYLNGKKYRNGTVVRANPVEQATGTLQKIGIGSDVYSISGSGTQQQADWAQSDSSAVDYIKNKPTIPSVEANPSGTGSVDLSKLEVDGTIYNIPSGGGSDLPLTVENGKLCIIYET